MDDLFSCLLRLGLTPFEAKAYLSLLNRGNLNGHELSKESGIPSSKIYSVLNQLIAKNLVIRLESHPTRYIPQTPHETIAKFSDQFREIFSFLRKNLKNKCHRPPQEEVVLRNIIGKKEIFRKTRRLITSTKHSLYIALWREEWRYVHAALKRLNEQGCKIYVVTYGHIPAHFGKIYRHAPSDAAFRERKERRFVLVSDDNKALFANFSGREPEKGVWADNHGLALLLRDFIIHEIYIIKIRDAFPKEIDRTFGPNWERIFLEKFF